MGKYYNDMISCEVKNLNLILMEPVVQNPFDFLIENHSSRDGHWVKLSSLDIVSYPFIQRKSFLRVKRKVAFEVKHF